MTRDLFHGTKNFECQIANNFLRRKLIKNKIKNLSFQSKSDTKAFINKYFLKQKLDIKNKLLNPAQKKT